MARLVALGWVKPDSHTIVIEYAVSDPAWQPRSPLESIQEFDPDAHTKEKEEAYGPDDVL